MCRLLLCLVVLLAACSEERRNFGSSRFDAGAGSPATRAGEGDAGSEEGGDGDGSGPHPDVGHEEGTSSSDASSDEPTDASGFDERTDGANNRLGPSERDSETRLDSGRLDSSKRDSSKRDSGIWDSGIWDSGIWDSGTWDSSIWDSSKRTLGDADDASTLNTDTSDANASGPRFSIETNEVIDLYTSLTWSRAVVRDRYCEIGDGVRMDAMNLDWNAGWCTHDGNPDQLSSGNWRVPSKAEFEAVAAGPGGLNAFLSEGGFTNLTHNQVWTSTVHTEGVCGDEEFGDCNSWLVEPRQWVFDLSNGTFTHEDASTYGTIWMWVAKD